jgi:hypothetical protein
MAIRNRSCRPGGIVAAYALATSRCASAWSSRSWSRSAIAYTRASPEESSPVRAGKERSSAAAAGRGADRAQQREPEQLRVVLARLHGHEGDPALLARPFGPRVQQ